MQLSATTFGSFNLYTVETGRFKLDGGSMFGVVPKTLWTKKIPSDDKNRIPMTTRCLLVESQNSGRVYLIDNGCGTKFDEKMRAIYGIDQQEYNLESSLEYHGFSLSDITDIIFTHLHFDHCGGSTYYDDEGEIRHTFPDARYHVTRSHWKTATNPNVREKASYMSANIEPIKASGRLHLNGDKHKYEDGLYIQTVHGHTKGQQLPVITHGKQRLIFMADLIPTTAHVPLPWIMGFDMCARETLKEKAELLNQAADKEWYLYLEHDYETELFTVQKSGSRFEVKETMTLSSL